jgi:putative nucleotidyltransferase with HDIG domain
MSLINKKTRSSPASLQHPFRWYNTLFGKLLIPVIGIMLLSMLVTGLVFDYGINSTSRKILEGEIQADSQNVISSLQGRLDTVNSAATVLANNNDIKSVLADDNAGSLSIINSRALVVRDRFELDLVQIYSANGSPRTNIVQSSLYKVSSVINLLPNPEADLFSVYGRSLYLVRVNIASGGTVIVGIDISTELNRIAFQLGLRDVLSIQDIPLAHEVANFSNGNYALETPFRIGSHAIILVHTRQISQFNTIADSGRNLILLSTVATTIFLISLLALVLNSIVRPVRRLADNARRLAQADFEHMPGDTIPLGSFEKPRWIGVNDEIGQLADSFAHMSRELQEIYHGLVHELRQTNEELSIAYDSALQGWSSALELRDHDTEKHTQRVSDYLIKLATYMGIPKDELVHYRRGALLHDVGKMAIPDDILRKQGPLTDEEWETMRQHPIYAYVMLRKIPFLQKALDIPYCHHEKWDGSGYPRGLLRKEIPLSARVFSVVDAWDALNFDRPYRKAWRREKVVDYISSKAGTDFDPEITKIFLDWLEKENP